MAANCLSHLREAFYCYVSLADNTILLCFWRPTATRCLNQITPKHYYIDFSLLACIYAGALEQSNNTVCANCSDFYICAAIIEPTLTTCHHNRLRLLWSGTTYSSSFTPQSFPVHLYPCCAHVSLGIEWLNTVCTVHPLRCVADDSLLNEREVMFAAHVWTFNWTSHQSF